MKFNNINSLLIKGFVSEKIDEEININEEIIKLRRKKNAVILAHYYQNSEVQEIADFVGDSLELSRRAATTNADVIVFSGVHFMAETAKILSPEKKVLIPDLNAGCSLAESCNEREFEEFVKENPNHLIVSYINTTAKIKALSDIICTSSNAMMIIDSLPKDQRIIFAPDKNLGNYIQSITGREMKIWNGACHVHEQFSLERILKLKDENPEAKIIAHPECEKPVLLVADFIGSTSALLKFSREDDALKYIVATESGILYQMKKSNPGKEFIAAPPKDSTCSCSDCSFMKLNTLRKIYLCLKYELPEVKIEESIRKRAELPMIKMMELSKVLGL